MKNKIYFIGELLAHLPIIHAAFALIYLLIIPTMRTVYFGTPYYWLDWDSTRTTALVLYLVTSGFVGFMAALARYMP